MLVLIKFKVRGNLRFLSHAEMVKVFQRASVRAGIKTEYSQGFNPRPKLSLPLPKSVAVESEDDLLCLRVKNSASSFDPERFKTRLSKQLPEGCELLSVSAEKEKVSFQPSAATYLLPVHQKYLNEKLQTNIKRLLASKSLNIQRQTKTKNSKSKFKSVDVRSFLKSVELDGRGITVECKITAAGTIRVDEILRMLGLDAEKLAGPIRRTNVQWQVSES